MARSRKIPAPSRTAAPASHGEYVRPETLVKRWDGVVTLGTLRNWRSAGRGPPWTKVGHRVVYPLDKLIEWESQNTTSFISCTKV